MREDNEKPRTVEHDPFFNRAAKAEAEQCKPTREHVEAGHYPFTDAREQINSELRERVDNELRKQAEAVVAKASARADALAAEAGPSPGQIAHDEERERLLKEHLADNQQAHDIAELEGRIITELHKLFPHGHPDFIPMCFDEMELHSKKNRDYTMGGDSLGNFHRVSAFFAMYPNLRLSDPVVLALAYAMKQLDATLWMLNSAYEGEVEGIDPRLGDNHIYVKIARILQKEKGKKAAPESDKHGPFDDKPSDESCKKAWDCKCDNCNEPEVKVLEPTCLACGGSGYESEPEMPPACPRCSGVTCADYEPRCKDIGGWCRVQEDTHYADEWE